MTVSSHIKLVTYISWHGKISHPKLSLKRCHEHFNKRVAQHFIRMSSQFQYAFVMDSSSGKGCPWSDVMSAVAMEKSHAAQFEVGNDKQNFRVLAGEPIQGLNSEWWK